MDMKNDNDFDDFTGYVAMINDREEKTRGCLTFMLPIADIILVCLAIFFVIASCS